jgi:hypothetical protein
LLWPLLLAGSACAIAEDITLTTYYPPPRGVYNQLKTSGDVGIGELAAAPAARLHVVQTAGAPGMLVEAGGAPGLMVDDGGNVGIGTPTPTASLDIAGAIRIADGSQGANRVLVSDATGMGEWEVQQVGLPFGGIYLPAAGPCQDPNPYTGACSCPAGYVAHPVTVLGWTLVFCGNP